MHLDLVFCKIHKAIVDISPHFRPLLSAKGTSTYTIAKFLVTTLNCLTINKLTVKVSFSFAKKIVQQDSKLCMNSLDVDSPFTNISFEETITICTESIYNQNDTFEGLSKSELKKLPCLDTKEHYFIFNE